LAVVVVVVVVVMLSPLESESANDQFWLQK